MFHHVPQRSFVSVIDGFAQVFTMLHSAGLPWGTAVIVGTIAFRVAFTAPIAVVQRRRVERLAAIQPVLRAWETTLKRSVVLKQGPLNDPDGYAKKLQTQFKEKANQLYKLNSCHPTHTFLLPWVQVPLFLSVSLAVRKLAGLPPWAFGGSAAAAVASDSTGVTSDIASSPLSALDTTSIATNTIDTVPINPLYPPADGFTTEGFLWFLDLSSPDPTVLLPLIVGGLHLANIE
ncbi:Cytochrome c oxidase assembly protein cox18, mitochondrial, partial [Rhizoclosmatium sp. JEL0117]